jgi:radical SAM protein with 4Fe4S-binding SPASM domain
MNYHIPRRYFTARKLVNLGQLHLSFQVASRLGRVAIRGKPAAIDIEPVNLCNLKCIECPTGTGELTRLKGYMSFDLFQKIIDELLDDLLTVSLFFQGEPYLHPQIFEMVRYAEARRVCTYVSTNGHFLQDDSARATVESGLHRLVISLDGIDSDAYRRYRINGDLDTVLQGIRNVVDWKLRLRRAFPEVVIRFLVFRHNEHQIPAVHALGRQLGVDRVAIKSAQIYDFARKQHLVPTLRRYSRYEIIDDNKVVLKREASHRCFRMWESCVFTVDGDVVPCCFDKNADHAMGNIRQRPFLDIWNGPEYNEFRRAVLSGDPSLEICTNCSEGVRP